MFTRPAANGATTSAKGVLPASPPEIMRAANVPGKTEKSSPFDKAPEVFSTSIVNATNVKSPPMAEDMM
jgi:hypothetical protein